MIKIKKFSNIYGIKSLTGAENLSKNVIIYSPNGTAKTSIADALKNIGDGKPIDEIKDVYGNQQPPSFEIDVEGQLCTENKPLIFNVLKYSGVQDFPLDNNINLSNVVISQNVVNQISTQLAQIKQEKTALKHLIDNCFPTKNTTEEYLSALSIIANTYPNDNDLYLKLIKKINLQKPSLSIEVDEKMFLNLVNNKMKDTCSLPTVIANSQQYFAITNNPNIISKQPSCFDCNFKLENLQDLHKSAKKNMFYNNANPIRNLYIDGKHYNDTEVDTLIQNEVDRIYGSNQAKGVFDEIAKSFKGQKKAVSVLKANASLVNKLSKYEELTEDLFLTIIKQVIPQITNILSNIQNAQKKIDDINKSYNSKDNKITEIWEKFNSRFKFKKFDLRIENEFNAIIGKEVPSFVKYIPGTTNKIKDPKQLRFSTGEIKTFNLINFIINVESLRMNSSPFTIVLDDAVDSFDYKNKYGMVDYLFEIKDDPKVQLIILTHNFDFYRSTALALMPNVEQYFGYKNSDNEIKLYDTSKNSYLLKISDFNNWKNNPSLEKYFALIPFSRNVLQLSSNSQNPSVKTLDDYIHYNKDLVTKTFSDINLTLHQMMTINMPSNINSGDLYLKKLNETIEKMLNSPFSIKETDLEYKITLGLYIRIFLERYLILNYKDFTGKEPTITCIYRKTFELIQINETVGCLNNDELKNVVEANVISPAYVHFNSFMYEPLIDVGISDLIDSAHWIHSKNAKWLL